MSAASTFDSIKRTRDSAKPVRGITNHKNLSALTQIAEETPLFKVGPAVLSHLSHDFSSISVYTPLVQAGPIIEFCPLRSSPTRCPYGGTCHTCPPRLQTKLAISQPNDEFEQEADRVTEQVMQSSILGEAGLQTINAERVMNTPLIVQRKEIKPIRIEEGSEKGGLQTGKAPNWAVPMTERIVFDAKRHCYKDLSILKEYSESEIEKYRKEAVNYEKWYTLLVQKLQKKIDEGIDPSIDVSSIIQREWRKISKLKPVVGGSVESREAGLCSIRIEPDLNPFLVFPFWRHELLHQRTCTSTYNKALQNLMQGRHDAPSIEMKLAGKHTSEAYRNAQFLMNDEIRSYKDTSLAIANELKKFSMIKKKSAVSQQKTVEPRMLQRKRGNYLEPMERLANVYEARRSAWQPLDAATRAFYEPRFGHDFSQVRVHRDSKAEESARAVNALAYTVGRDVVFGAGQYAPGTNKGQRLIAHELTHVLQQCSAPSLACHPVLPCLLPRPTSFRLARWKKAGTVATVDNEDDRLWDLAKSITGRGEDWACIWPIDMKSPRSWDEDYQHYIQIGDKFDISNLTLQVGPSATFVFVGANDEFLTAVQTLYGGTAVFDLEDQIANACRYGRTPLRSLTVCGHTGGTRMWGNQSSFTPSGLGPEEPNPSGVGAHGKCGPHRCWFTRNASVRFVGCTSKTIAEAFAQVFLRKGSEAIGTGRWICGWFTPPASRYLTAEGPPCNQPTAPALRTAAAVNASLGVTWVLIKGRL